MAAANTLVDLFFINSPVWQTNLVTRHQFASRLPEFGADSLLHSQK